MNVQSSGPSAKIITAGPRIDHVDGLRAIAVIAVVAYHASIPGFATGFTGVDIFFVISGFLIINQIVGELRQNRFSLATFYARRTIRILPPLLVMLLGAYLIACFVLISPFEWENFGLSGSLSAVFLSNFYFYKKQGYFDTTAMDKPLLHTWSLSVEEQFYIITPLLLIGLFLLARRTRKPVSTYLAGAGGIFFIASLIGCILLTIPVKNKAFYMTTWRGWEFIAGGAVAWLAAQPALQSRRWIAEAAGLAGIVLAVVAINFGLSEINYPSYGAITPVAAAVLLILSGLLDPDCTAARLLSVRPMVLVGLISYSWYLWHWPLISMAQIAQFSTENHLRDAVMAGLSLIPAVLSYRYVELPCRRWRHARDLRALGWMPVRRGLAASLAVFALIGTTGGAVYALTRYGPEIAGDPSLIDPPRIVCTGDSCKVPGHIRGVLYGDSHADRLRVPTIREAQAFGVDLVLPPKADDGPLDFVIIHRLWAGRFQNFYHLYYDVDDTTDFKAIWEKKLAGYSDGGKRRLLVVGPVPVFDNWQADCIYRAWRYGIDKDRCSTTRERYERHARQQIDDLRDIVSHLPNARFIDVTGLFCDDRMCRAYIGDSLLMRDTDHLSTFGSDWFYSKIRHHMVWAMTGKDESAGLALH